MFLQTCNCSWKKVLFLATLWFLVGLETKVGGVLKSWDHEDSENGAGCKDWPSNSWENEG